MGDSLRVAMVIAAAVAGIASATAPTKHDVQRARTIDADFESTWTALIDVFADHNWAIDKIDKDSGIITTDWMSTGDDADRFADCGSRGLAGHDAAEVRFNVRVKDLQPGAEVTVNTSFRERRVFDDEHFVANCETRGVVENLIQAEVTPRAAAEMRRRAAKRPPQQPPAMESGSAAGSGSAAAPAPAAPTATPDR